MQGVYYENVGDLPEQLITRKSHPNVDDKLLKDGWMVPLPSVSVLWSAWREA